MFTIKPLNVGSVETEVVGDFVNISTNDESNYCILPQKYVDKCLNRIKNIEVYEDDIWLISFPKCGKNWTQEMVRLINNDLNYEKDLHMEIPFLE